MDKHTIRDNTTGKIDIAASTHNYAKALSLWISQNEIEQSKVENAVNAVMDRFPEKLPMPMLINLSVQEISDEPNQYKPLEKHVKAFIATQREAGKISVKKGPTGGVKRVAPGDVKTEENVSSEEQEIQDTGS